MLIKAAITKGRFWPHQTNVVVLSYQKLE